MVVRLSPRQAAQFLLPDPPKKVAPKNTATADQTFDASRIYDYEDLPNGVTLDHHNQIQSCGINYLQLQMMLDATNRDLHDHVMHCNRIAWGSHDWAITRRPTQAEQAQVPSMMNALGDRAINWRNKARKAHEARVFAESLAEALEVAREKTLARGEAAYDRDTEAELRAQFEASEEASREARFQEWRLIGSSKSLS